MISKWMNKLRVINFNIYIYFMVKIYSISTIRKKVREYGKKINAPSHLLTVRTTSNEFGTPHIEIDENGYSYVIRERASEHERRQTKSFKELFPERSCRRKDCLHEID